MSGRYSRNKGRRFEQELVNILKAGGVPAKRISMMETGNIDKGDVELEIAGIWKGEVKGGEQIPEFVYKARKSDEQFLFMRKDRKQWLVCMDLAWFLEKFI